MSVFIVTFYINFEHCVGSKTHCKNYVEIDDRIVYFFKKNIIFVFITVHCEYFIKKNLSTQICTSERP